MADETVIELATAITPEYTKLRRILKAWEADHPDEALHPEEIHDDVHDRFNELGGYRLEAKAKQILAGLSFREQGFRPARARDERRLGDAGAPGPVADAGAGPAAAGRADQPSRPGSAALVPGVPEELPRGDSRDLARPRVPEPACREHRRDPPEQADPLPRRLRRVSRSNARPTSSSSWPPTNTRSAKSAA